MTRPAAQDERFVFEENRGEIGFPAHTTPIAIPINSAPDLACAQCDGGSHSGALTAPVTVGNNTIY
jgi:O-palmitoleoyl-L-serine hydrolase